MNNPKYSKFKSQNGDYYFNLRAGNGEIILTSEGYTTSTGCDNGIASVRANSPIDSRYNKLLSKDNKYYFTLKAGNGEIIGMSQMYQTEAGRDNGIESVKENGPTSPVEDLTKG